MDIEYITSIVQKITNKEFSSDITKRLNIHHDRINFRCPYCHEGNTQSKKRCNLYFNKLFVICYRCDKKTNFDKLCKDFNEQLDPSKKMEMIEHLNNVIDHTDIDTDLTGANFNNLIHIDSIIKAVNMNLTDLSDLQPVVKNGGVYKYLINRGIDESKHKNIYQAKYWINEDTHEYVIAMLNKKGDNVIGIQIRNLKQGKRRNFKIYNYETLHQWVNASGEEIDVDMNQMVIYNKLSYFFNILNVDLSKRVTLFEGYLDSLFFPNSIGLTGVNTSDKLLSDNDVELQFLYDNDSVGHNKSEKKLKEGHKVFLWSKLMNYIVDNKKTDDPYKLLYRINTIKDLNGLANLVNDPYTKLNLQSFFSNDILDLKWIPKIKLTFKNKFI